MLSARLVFALFAILAACANACASDLMPGFTRSPNWNEQVREAKTREGIRYLVNAPEAVHSGWPTSVIFYTTPNGNTIEQTLGCQTSPGMDWHYDIQHIAAQIRLLRQITPKTNIVLVCAEAEGRSWPGWRAKHADNAALIKAFVDDTIKGLPGSSVSVTLSGHSGGGSMLFGFLNSTDAIPSNVTRIVWLDANYAYSDDDKHGDKLIAWLKADPNRCLVVLCYDDRNITLDGKPVLGPTGGTYRATERMRARFEKDMKLDHTSSGDVDRYTGLDGRVTFIVHRNPANKILHTALIGEMNGFLEAITLNTPMHSKWAGFGAPRAYTKWIQPAPPSPAPVAPAPKAESAPKATIAATKPSPAGTGGTEIMSRVASMSREDREAVLAAEVKAGNTPAEAP